MMVPYFIENFVIIIETNKIGISGLPISVFDPIYESKKGPKANNPEYAIELLRQIASYVHPESIQHG